MYRVFSVILGSLLLASATLAQQDGEATLPKRKAGTIYKSEVDGLVGVLRSTARQDIGSPAAPGVVGSDVLTTAKILTSMGHCHRRPAVCARVRAALHAPTCVTCRARAYACAGHTYINVLRLASLWLVLC